MGHQYFLNNQFNMYKFALLLTLVLIERTFPEMATVLDWKMEANIAGLDAIHNKANALGVALMVGAVKKVGLEMDVMVLLGGLIITFVCLNHQIGYPLRKICRRSSIWFFALVMMEIMITN